jgi:hypothetical protein
VQDAKRFQFELHTEAGRPDMTLISEQGGSIFAQVSHLYGLTRDEFAHILGAFPLVFPDNAAGQQKKVALLAVYERMAGRRNG